MIYRLFFAIAAGAMFCATPCAAETSSQTQRQQLDVQRAIAADVGQIAKSSVEQDVRARQPDPLNAPCPPGTDSRGSDLCAQWKAADAAKISADYGWHQFAVGWAGIALGFVTMGAAIAAAYFAKRAADETRRIGEAQVRCYLTIEKVTFSHVSRKRGLYLFIRNSGQTPARQVSYFARIGYCPFGESEMRWSKEFAPVDGRNQMPVAAGDIERCTAIALDFPLTTAEANSLSILTPISIWCEIRVTAVDVFGIAVTAERAFVVEMGMDVSDGDVKLRPAGRKAP